MQPKKCAICACIEEGGKPTCRMCGEASWLGIWVDGKADTPQLTMIEPEPAPKPKRGKK